MLPLCFLMFSIFMNNGRCETRITDDVLIRPSIIVSIYLTISLMKCTLAVKPWRVMYIYMKYTNNFIPSIFWWTESFLARIRKFLCFRRSFNCTCTRMLMVGKTCYKVLLQRITLDVCNLLKIFFLLYQT